MLVAFLSAVLDPVLIAAASVGVLFAKSALRLRLFVLAIAFALALVEAIPDGFNGAWLAHVAGTCAAALALAECARYIVAPVAAAILQLAAFGLARIRRS